MCRSRGGVVTSLGSGHADVLAITCKKRITVDGYQDQAVGIREIQHTTQAPRSLKSSAGRRWYALAGT